MAKPKAPHKLTLRIGADVAREIRQHARSSSKMEVCGVLIGSDSNGVTSITACISGVNAAQGGAHVTFTQDTWEHIYKVKDRKYPDDRIVGWYHSHPGFGVFLSEHDAFIHQNFFSSPQQVAWVYDPHSDEEGCFGWRNERLERLETFSVIDAKGGEIAGASLKPEPVLADDQESEESEESAIRREDKREDADMTRLARTVSAVFSHLAILLLGGLLVWYLFPRILVMPVPVDPNTGRPVGKFQDLIPERPNAQGLPHDESNATSPAGQSGKPDSTKPQRDDVHQ